MPTHGLRLQAYELLALALKAHDEGRPADAYDLTAKAMEHLEDAMSVEELRRTQRKQPFKRAARVNSGLTYAPVVRG
jgi:hypothetical protein